MNEPAALNPAMVSRIQVDRLFGYYTYDLQLDTHESELRSAPVLLLYGDNGSGKTTIAQLLFHLLSREDGRGHRTFLAQTKFKAFTVTFQNSAQVAAERQGDELIGPYFLRSRDARGREYRTAVRISDDGSVKSGDVDENELRAVLDSFSQPSIAVYHLSDNRSLLSDEFDSDRDDEFISNRGRLLTRKRGDAIEHMIVASSSRTRSLEIEPSIWRAETWMRRQAITASNIGEENISTIYSEIVERVANPPDSKTPEEDKLPSLSNALFDLAEKSQSFVTLGMMPKVPTSTLRKSIERVPDRRRALLVNVLEPYVDGIRARLNALSGIQQRLSTFLGILNAFYRKKTVRVTLSDGIEVFDEHQERLDANLLSSGEKQLMLLLCNILASTNQPTIFIIDEPELSLNVKWQRRLVDSLLRLVEGGEVQFIMATHSIELLTQHMRYVLRLEDIGEGNGAKSS